MTFSSQIILTPDLKTVFSKLDIQFYSLLSTYYPPQDVFFQVKKEQTSLRFVSLILHILISITMQIIQQLIQKRTLKTFEFGT